MVMQGYLEKQDNGRFAIHHELTSGDVVEVYKNGEWHRSSIEFDHENKEYYLTDGTPIHGAFIRTLDP